MIKQSWAIIAVVITALLSSFIYYDNALGVALKLTQFEIIGVVIGISFVLFFKEKKQSSSPTQ